jgi:hydrogenase expression/formation protein HypE
LTRKLNSKILLAHGSGGRLMHNLIRELLLPKLNNPWLKKLSDSALFGLAHNELAFTTDSYVVHPLFFPGGDIGKLAVSGTINDLVVSGAAPVYLSLALIIEEGLDYSVLQRVVNSVSAACRNSKIKIITGDIKVVDRGACDKLFINTAGIGRVIRRLNIEGIRAGDIVMVTGRIAEHGLSILSRRKGIDFGLDIKV